MSKTNGNGRAMGTSQTLFDLAFAHGQSADVLRAPYAEHSWTYACIRSIARNIKGVPLLVKQGTGHAPLTDRVRAMQQRAPGRPLAPQVEDDGTVVTDQGNATVRLFAHPNPCMSRAKLWEATAVHLWTGGSCAWAKVGAGGGLVTSPTEHPRELWPLPGAGLTALIDQRSQLPRSWRGSWAGSSIEFLPHQLVWFTFFNPYDSFKGQAPLQACQVTVEGDYRANRYNASFFQNGAHPSGIIKTKANLPQPQVEQIRTVWNDQHQGASKGHRVAILTGDAEWIASATSQKEMEFNQLRESARREVCATIGPVPPIELGLSDDYTRATAREAVAVLFDRVIIPELQDWEDTLEVEVGNWTGGRNWVEFDLTKVEALRENTASKADASVKFFGLGIPLDQLNSKFGLGFDMQRVPHASQSFLPAGMQLVTDMLAASEARARQQK